MVESKKSHFRGKPRPAEAVEILYQLPGEEERKAFTKNIGVGGAFVLMLSPPKTGTLVELQVIVPTSKAPIPIKGEVRWIVDGKRGEPADQHGMGVKFQALNVDQLLVLNEYFASITQTVDHD